LAKAASPLTRVVEASENCPGPPSSEKPTSPCSPGCSSTARGGFPRSRKSPRPSARNCTGNAPRA